MPCFLTEATGKRDPCPDPLSVKEIQRAIHEKQSYSCTYLLGAVDAACPCALPRIGHYMCTRRRTVSCKTGLAKTIRRSYYVCL